MKGSLVNKELYIRIKSLKMKQIIMTADQAISLIEDGITIATSGFIPGGYPKIIPLALTNRLKRDVDSIRATRLESA
jgi:succinyl-CoA:acetate CoA-transferase